MRAAYSNAAFWMTLATHLMLLNGFLGHGALSCAGAEAPTGAKKTIAREVTFAGAKGVKLAGTLLIPALPAHEPDAKLSGVIIVAGSGAINRDGNSPGVRVTVDLLKQIAEALAQEGIASLRYDKRSIGASAGPKEGESLAEFITWENFLGDAVAALAFLQDRPEIDPRRTAMVGHSEGGMLILQAAGEGKGFRRPPAALVLAGTPGRRGDVVVRQQIARNPLHAWLLAKENDRIMAAIQQTGRVPDDVPPLLASVYPRHLGKYLQCVLNFEGAAWAARVPCPVLVIAGEKDLNHVVAVETAALSDALKTRPRDDHEVSIVPGASHHLKKVTIIDPNGYGGKIVPDAAAKLRSWLRNKLGVAAHRDAVPEHACRTTRCAERRPGNARWQSRSHRGAAVGELIR